MDTDVVLESLVGEHTLSGADEAFSVVRGDSVTTLAFVLDGLVYWAVEDPSDGYRSYLNGLTRKADSRVTNTFDPVRVVGSIRKKGSYGEDEVLELRDIVTGDVVIEVGTQNIDDYYPSFVGNFWPQNMAINRIAQ